MKRCVFFLLALLGAVLAGCGTAEAPPQTVEVTVSDPPGPARRVEVPLGAEVTLRITTAKDDHAHLHGYELESDTSAGKSIDLVFTADMAGSYELESHVTNAVWLNLIVK